MQVFGDLVLLLLLFQNFWQRARSRELVNTKDRSLDNLHFGSIDPEAYMTVPEIIQYRGYPVKSYDVQTDDGYILTVFRIPYGKVKTSNQTRGHVLIQHGLLTNAGMWLGNLPEKNLPYRLADCGFDVWLSNVRGTEFGRKHVHVRDKDQEFWDFSFSEMAKYDIPKIIDTILEETGANHVHYIGHSMGTTIGFAMLSSQQKYNQIVKSFIALAPVTAPGNCEQYFNVTAIAAFNLKWLAHNLGYREFSLITHITNILLKKLCQSPLVGICTKFFFTLTGEDYEQFNQSRLPVFFHLGPDDTSWDTVAHFGQVIKSKKFEHRDFGRVGNMKKYGQPTPPLYDLSKITTPVALFWSDNDRAAVPEDVATIASQIKSITLNYHIPYANFTHYDFAWAKDVNPLLYDKVVDTLKAFYEGVPVG